MLPSDPTRDHRRSTADILMLRKYSVFVVWPDHYRTYRMRPLDGALWSQLTACHLTTLRFSTTEFKGKGKGKGHSVTCHEGPEWSRGIAPLFRLRARWGFVVSSTTWPLNLRERHPVPIVHSCQQKSIGLKFSKSQTGSYVRYSCHHNSSRFTFPIFAHSCRFSVLHSLQSITPRIY